MGPLRSLFVPTLAGCRKAAMTRSDGVTLFKGGRRTRYSAATQCEGAPCAGQGVDTVMVESRRDKLSGKCCSVKSAGME